MRVCVLTTRHKPDDDRIFYKETLSLRKVYSDITLVAPGDREDLNFHDSGIRLVPLTGASSGRGRWGTVREAVRAVARLDPDICHFHDLDIVPAIPALRRAARARLVYDAHEVYPEAMLISPRIPRLLRPFAKRVVDVLEKRLARQCSLIITADDPNTESFRMHGLPAVTVFNYPRLSLFETDDEEVSNIRKGYGPGPVLLYQGSMGKERGLFHMIRAMELLRREIPNVRLALLGLGNVKLRAQVEELAERLGVSDAIQITTWVPHVEIAAHMKAATVGLVPWQPVEKHKKNIPIKVFEYMACGLPIVAADLPSIETYVGASGSGILYDSTRPEELARCVLELLSNPERRRRMGEAGLRAVREQWNWAAMEKILFDVYNSLDTGADGGRS